MTRRVAIFQRARLASQRLPRKLLEVVAGETLLERGLAWMSRLCLDENALPIVACPKGDREIIEAVERHRMEILLLEDEETQTERWEDHYHGVARRLDKMCDWIWDANILCRPFLSKDVGRRILRALRETTRPFVTVTERRGIVWDAEQFVISGQGRLANTKTNPRYYELAHLGYGLPVALLGHSEQLVAASCVPLPVDLGWMDRIDIDTADDLLMAQCAGERR